MITQRELQTYLHRYLNCGEFKDYCPNGLQVQGAANIDYICSAVTASKEVIEQAAHRGADALLVHHGFFWKGEAPEIIGMKHARIKALLLHDLNLFAYHLPLDCHAEHGNNVLIGKKLNLKDLQGHRVSEINQLLWTGALPQTFEPQQILGLLENTFQRQALMIKGCDKPIQQLAWCSGGAQDYIVEAAALGADAYISGEISERTYYQARELGIHYFACGHHATERFGVQSLGNYLADTFHLKHDFIDSDNPI